MKQTQLFRTFAGLSGACIRAHECLWGDPCTVGPSESSLSLRGSWSFLHRDMGRLNKHMLACLHACKHACMHAFELVENLGPPYPGRALWPQASCPSSLRCWPPSRPPALIIRILIILLIVSIILILHIIVTMTMIMILQWSTKCLETDLGLGSRVMFSPPAMWQYVRTVKTLFAEDPLGKGAPVQCCSPDDLPRGLWESVFQYAELNIMKCLMGRKPETGCFAWRFSKKHVPTKTRKSY